MRIKLIINPEAGIQKKTISRIKQNLFFGKKNKTIDAITTFFKERGHKLSVSKTKEPGDATKISKMAKDYDIIIAAGGDGTINEVINGAGKKARIGIIPTGSENVFAKEIKIPRNIKKACEIIIAGKEKKIDLGDINNKKFIFAAGIGFDAHAITNVKKEIKKFIGKHSYTLAGLKTLFEHRPEELQINIDNKIKKTGYFVIISNVQRYGGNIKIAPKAKLDDGKLDVCIFTSKSLLSNIKYLIGAASGQLAKISEIEQYQAKTIRIRSRKKVLYHTDAEIGGTIPVNIKVLEKYITIIVP